MSGTITPKFNTSKIFVQVSGDVNNNGAGNNIILTLYRSIGGGGFSNIGHSTYGFTQLRGDGSRMHVPVYIGYLDSPSTTSAVTYKVYVRKTAAGSGNVEFPAQNDSKFHLHSYDGGFSIMSELRTNRIIPRDGLVSGTNLGGGIIQCKMGVNFTYLKFSWN